MHVTYYWEGLGSSNGRQYMKKEEILAPSPKIERTSPYG